MSVKAEGETKTVQQDNAQRMAYINKMRSIRAEMKDKEQQLLISQSPKQLTQIMKRTDDLFNQVETPSAMTQDCDTFKSITQIAVSQIASINIGLRSVNLANVSTKLFNRFGEGDTLNWEKLGEWGLRYSRVAPIPPRFLFGLGEFHVIHRERKQGQRSQKDVIENQKSVQSVENNENKENKLLKRARALCDRLKKNGEIPLSQVITTPIGFAQTVENAFDVAHLVRDGKVGLEKKNDQDRKSVV